MKRPALWCLTLSMVLLSLVIGLVGWWSYSGRSSRSGSLRQGQDHGPIGQEETASPAVRQAVSSQAGEPPFVSLTETNALPADLEALLANPSRRIRMREVTQLDAEMERELVRRFHTAGDVASRYKVLQTLVYGGSGEAVPLIARTVTNDYARASLASGERAKLVHLLQLMGISAGTHEEALEWLMTAADPGFWKQFSDPADPESRVMQERPVVLAGNCLKGLALSTRAEGWAVIEELRSDPARVVELGVDSFMIDAAFRHDMVAEHGLQGAMDGCLYSIDQRMEAFRSWKYSTTNGLAWKRWIDAIRP